MKHILYFIKKLQSFSGKALYINLVGMILVSLFEGIAIFLLIPMLSVSGILNVDAGVIPIPGVAESLRKFKLILTFNSRYIRISNNRPIPYYNETQ